MNKTLEVCKVCGCQVLSGYTQCDGSYYQAEDDSCAAGKQMPNETGSAASQNTPLQWQDK